MLESPSGSDDADATSAAQAFGKSHGGSGLTPRQSRISIAKTHTGEDPARAVRWQPPSDSIDGVKGTTNLGNRSRYSGVTRSYTGDAGWLPEKNTLPGRSDSEFSFTEALKDTRLRARMRRLVQKFIMRTDHPSYRQGRDALSRYQFINAIRLAPTHLFEFRDSAIEASLAKHLSLQDPSRGQLQMTVIVFLIHCACWICVHLSILDLQRSAGESSQEITILNVTCGLAVVLINTMLLLFICRIRAYTYQLNTRNVGVQYEALGSAETTWPVPTGFFQRSPETISRRAESVGIEIRTPVAPDKREMRRIMSHESTPSKVPWYARRSWLMRLCLHENLLVCLFLLSNGNLLCWHILALQQVRLWADGEGSPTAEEKGRLRLGRNLLHLQASMMEWTMLFHFLTSKSVSISSRKCVWLMLCQLVVAVLPISLHGAMEGHTYPEEILATFLAVAMALWFFVTKFRSDMNTRLIFYLGQSAAPLADPGGITTTTGMEDLLTLLSEIGRLATVGSPENTIRILSKIEGAKRQLTQYQNLFKVRVTGRTDILKSHMPLEYAKMYGMDLGSDSARESMIPTSGVTISAHARSQQGRSRSGRRGSKGGRINWLRPFTLSEGLPAALQFKLHHDRCDIPAADSDFRAISAPGGESGTVPLIQKTPHQSRATKPAREQRNSPTHHQLGGFSPSEIPKRTLTRKLANIAGEQWNVNLFDFNDQCGGNILVEVGYALIGRKISRVAQEYPETIDPAIVAALHSNSTEARTLFRQRSSLIIKSMGVKAASLTRGPPHSDVAAAEGASLMPNTADFHFSVWHHYVFMSFLYGLQEQYFKMPYHNAVHAAHVAHSISCLTKFIGLPGGSAHTVTTEFAYVLGALGHDVGHPGRNNTFFTNSYDPLSVIYNDVSVLENYHCCQLFTTLELENCNCLFPFSTEVFRQMRELIIQLILATDMKHHFEAISRFKVRLADPSFNPYESYEDLKLVLEMCIKAADLSSSASDWPVHKEWCMRVVEEFYRQGEREARLELAISPLCDRSKHETEFINSQQGFIEFVTLPLFNELRAFADPQDKLLQLVRQLQNNKLNWADLGSQSPSAFAIPERIRQLGRELDPPPEPASSPDSTKEFKKRRWTSIIGAPGLLNDSIDSVSIMAGGRRQSATCDPGGSLGSIKSSSSWTDLDGGTPMVRHQGEARRKKMHLVPITSTTLVREMAQEERHNPFARSRGSDSETWSLGAAGPSEDGGYTDGGTDSEARFPRGRSRTRSASASFSSLYAASASIFSNPVRQKQSGIRSVASTLLDPSARFRDRRRRAMRRDFALSPSARVAPLEEKEPNVLAVISRRVSVLQPIRQDSSVSGMFRQKTYEIPSSEAPSLP